MGDRQQQLALLVPGARRSPLMALIAVASDANSGRSRSEVAILASNSPAAMRLVAPAAASSGRAKRLARR